MRVSVLIGQQITEYDVKVEGDLDRDAMLKAAEIAIGLEPTINPHFGKLRESGLWMLNLQRAKMFDSF